MWINSFYFDRTILQLFKIRMNKVFVLATGRISLISVIYDIKGMPFTYYPVIQLYVYDLRSKVALVARVITRTQRGYESDPSHCKWV